jgi:hypothetical protein
MKSCSRQRGRVHFSTFPFPVLACEAPGTKPEQKETVMLSEQWWVLMDNPSVGPSRLPCMGVPGSCPRSLTLCAWSRAGKSGWDQPDIPIWGLCEQRWLPAHSFSCVLGLPVPCLLWQLLYHLIYSYNLLPLACKRVCGVLHLAHSPLGSQVLDLGDTQCRYRFTAPYPP